MSPQHPPLSAYRDFMGWDVPWYSAQDSTDALLAGRRFAILVCYPRRGDTVFETYQTSGRRLEVMAASHGLLDMTVDGRQETWQDSPAGWPHRWHITGEQVRTNGRPTAQWARLEAGRSDDLGNIRPLAWSPKGRRSLASSLMGRVPVALWIVVIADVDRGQMHMPEMVKRTTARFSTTRGSPWRSVTGAQDVAISNARTLLARSRHFITSVTGCQSEVEVVS